MAISFASFVLFIVNFRNFEASQQVAKNTRQFPCTFGPSVLLARNGEIRLLIGELSWCRLNLMPDYSANKKFVNVLIQMSTNHYTLQVNFIASN